MNLDYFNLYCSFVDLYSKFNKKTKLRLIKKHHHMSESHSVKKFPRMRNMIKGRKVYTYQIGNEVFFTNNPKQKFCRSYTLYKTSLVLIQKGDRSLF